ncbi:3-hydroxyacyl-CoA dehydrogenase NAD-binding domain-containing protein [Chelativorans sp. YIM 93263]|uniref:3-hydroxyacyl-CoA dehydrogenase NAD-binding domain-containing protein n=1 Tax=Chelativorans sp. YIM 93263 TaxID=2906648 RepID=UPI002379E294|nr:3-hydroxyacyl-CoA dehydrogenase NAD-binding domain-containing protein [Chelativorans sp. YIM 93263]
MTERAVTLQRVDDVALLMIDNPPVNALSHHMRVDLEACLDKAAADSNVRAVVIAGKGRSLCAGADIRQLNAPPQEPTSPEIFMHIAALKKPVVAAIHGPTLGGGFELALACHGRVAAPDAQIGLPEIRLGLIPGAGGTFRLPRLIGAAAALRLMAEGRRLDAEEALSMGLVDAVSHDLQGAAIALAQQLADDPKTAAAARADREDFEHTAEKVLRRARGADALAALVEAVRDSFRQDDATAQKEAQRRFQELRSGDQSAAMRHLFFAERKAARLPVDVSGTAGTIDRAAVVGAGTMGGGIAMSFADAGIPVVLIDAKQEMLEKGLARIRKNYEISVGRGRISPDECEARMALITPATALDAADGANVVVEAVFEDMELKQRLFRDLDGIVAGEAVLASNTSSLDINAIASATQHPERVIGLHFFSPANVMRLLEIVRGARTSGDSLATALAIAGRLDKQPAVVGNCPGFVGNRILRQRHHQAELLLEQGARPAEVDGAVTRFGMAMGPFQMNDLAGLDVSRLVRQSQGYNLPVADALCEMGRLGQKTGAGYYRYEDGRTPIPDPETDRLIESIAVRLGVKQRTFSEEEIIARLFYPMVNEGARVLEEGIAARPSDIDVIYVHGYGFPAWRGGLMYWADQEGLDRIASALDAWSREAEEERLRPAPLLAQLAGEGRSFAEWNAERNSED